MMAALLSHAVVLLGLCSLCHPVCGFSTTDLLRQLSLTSRPTRVATPQSTTVRFSSAAATEDSIIAVDETNARSVFGTKDYWDDVYLGRGDFPADCYTWYYGWEVLGRIIEEFAPKTTKPRILIPGIGNDSILLDLYKAGYRNLVGQDYSEHAVERQIDLLSYEGIPRNLGEANPGDVDNGQFVQILQGDVTNLPPSWSDDQFDVILEKGLLDAVYLSGDGNVEAAVQNLQRVLRRGGLVISVSGVVPRDLRKSLFVASESKQQGPGTWEWLKDGSDDLKAGCFVMKKG